MKPKSITFDKKAQDELPQHIKDKMKADREKAVFEKKLKTVTEDIRSKLPRLMELQQGSIIRIDFIDGKSMTEKVIEIKGDLVFYNFSKNTISDFKINSIEGNIIEASEYYIQRVVILGTEPMLNDVLETIYCLFDDSEKYNLDTQILDLWDFSKPYLHQQSKGLINFLHKILLK